jgi:threonylcarbamoyladenosine tRNA methylthiotransferase MtaB
LTWLRGATYNLNLIYARHDPEEIKLTVEEGWSSPGTVALQTVGCKLNQAETDSLTRKFLNAGYQVVASTDAADIYLLNTCTVTQIADHKCRKLLRVAHRRNPSSLIVVTGCYAERAAEDLANIEGIDLIIGSRDKESIVEIIGNKTNGYGVRRGWSEPQNAPMRTRASVKIQEGCSQPCTFCIVPQVRGAERSRPEYDIINEVRDRVAEGYQEIILTGTRIGCFGHNGGLQGLITRILAECGVQRLRLSSLEPSDITAGLLGLWEDSRLCPHIHLPLQSGSDSVLARMGRTYSTVDYERAVLLARESISNLSLTTDVIVGFPGESDEEFDESYRFCKRMGYANLHVFPYSARPGTGAQRLGNMVKDAEKKRRVHLMLDLANKSSRQFRECFLGQNMGVLWEGKKDGIWFGLTDNYMRVYVASDEPLANKLVVTSLVAQKEDGIQGELSANQSLKY